jgi:hypothetical protein
LFLLTGFVLLFNFLILELLGDILWLRNAGISYKHIQVMKMQ